MRSYRSIPPYILLAILAFAYVGCLSLDIPRHIDLSEASEEGPQPLLLLNLYMDIARLVSVEDFDSALKSIAESYAIYMPGDLRYIFSRFNELLEDLTRRLNRTSILVSIAEGRVRIGDRSGARPVIDDGFRSIVEANITYTELYRASIEFSRRVGVSIYRGIEGLEDRIRYYYDRLRSILEVLEGIAEAKPTSITLILSSGEAWVGSTVKATGILTAEGEGLLPGREIEIRLAGYSYRVRTGVTGLFTYELRIPYIYVDEVDVYASYDPRGGDLGLYLPSISNVERLRILYLKPILTLHVDRVKLEPTDRFRVYGRIEPGSLDMYIEFLSRRIEPRRGLDGSFEATLTVPSNVAEGLYRIAAFSKPEGVYGPASRYVEVEVSRRPISLELSAPGIALAGSTVTVYGRIAYMGTPVEASVDVSSQLVSESLKAAGGFELNLHIPLTILTGSYRIEFSVHPYDPRFRGLSTYTDLYIVNPITLPIPLIVAGVVLGYIASGFVKRRSTAPALAGAGHIVGGLSRGVGEVKPKTGIAGLYAEAVEIVEAYTGVEAKPSYTAREYLSMVSSILGYAGELFKRITAIHELTVYGGYEADIDEASKLLAKLRGVIGGGGVG
ncbi:MAG: DUF4129 domain-containing protein [Candidatus Bathyarchaeia archaeon]